MGTDINGWVEIKEYSKWYGVINIRNMLYRNYDAFSCLFGVNNYACYTAIASNRGIPNDASHEVYADEILYEESTFGHSWITLTEIESIDWNVYAKEVDQRIKQYQKKQNGEWILKSKSLLPNPPIINISKEGRFVVGNTLYEVERRQRRDVLPYWQPLFEMMQILGRMPDYTDVRLVVYFDR